MINTYGRDDSAFIVTTDVGLIKFQSVMIGHVDTMNNPFKIKLLDGTNIGTYTMSTLEASDVVSFTSTGIVKFSVYDMADNLIPCGEYEILNIDNKPIRLNVNPLICV